jgi:hypothetical protein
MKNYHSKLVKKNIIAQTMKQYKTLKRDILKNENKAKKKNLYFLKIHIIEISDLLGHITKNICSKIKSLKVYISFF